MAARNRPLKMTLNLQEFSAVVAPQPPIRAGGELGIPLRHRKPPIRRRQIIPILMRQTFEIPQPVAIRHLPAP